MTAVGIITEYNPFHEGHIIHINESRRKSGADVVVCVMSADFVQRGEPAIIDKFSRAKMAILGGADMVVELPVSASLSSAEGFAESAVKHLNELRVSSICFGSENSDIEVLSNVSNILIDEPADFKTVLREGLRNGGSYAKSRQDAVAACVGRASAKVLEKPNNLLGIEYIKAIKKNSFDIRPYCIQRTGAGYNDTDISSSDIPSASAIRLAYETGREGDINIPEFTKQIIRESGCFPITFNHFGQMFYYSLETLLSAVNYDKSAFIDALSKFSDLSAETAARIYAVYTQSMTSGKIYTLEEFALAVKTKQFPLSRIKRNIMRFVLDLDTDTKIPSNGNDTDTRKNINYLRVLGFNKKGQKYIASIKDELSVPLITKVAPYKDIYSYEIHAHNIYRQVCMSTYGNAPVSDFVAKPFMT
jgi:predicted nucleotidyltransferase